MNERSRLSDHEITDLLHRRAARPAPDELATAVLESLASERALRPLGTPRRSTSRPLVLLAAAATAILVAGALAAGSGLLGLPAVVPPAPLPSLAAVVASAVPTPTRTPTPRVAESPSSRPTSLKLSWTQLALDEKSPRLAWVVDRFVLADMESGAVRTSTDGVDWQALEPGDARPGYVHLLGGSLTTEGALAAWQDTVVGFWNPQEGPDTPNKPPITDRDIVTIVRPPAAPISTTPFTGRVESIGVGPRGIVAEVHSHLDPEYPGDDPGSGWYSPTGEHWTRMARGTSSSAVRGSRLPTGAFGQVVGVADGFIASGACVPAPDSCYGLWFSADGLTWRFLGRSSGGGLVPWMGGALVTTPVPGKRQSASGSGQFQFWTSDGERPLPADLGGLVGTGPLDVFGDKSLIPAEMADHNHGGSHFRPIVAVGDQNVLVLERDNNATVKWSLWLGTIEH
jgi:hypothetical protein